MMSEFYIWFYSFWQDIDISTNFSMFTSYMSKLGSTCKLFNANSKKWCQFLIALKKFTAMISAKIHASIG